MSSNMLSKVCRFRSLRVFNSLYSNQNRFDLFINKRLIFGINKSSSNENHSQSEQQQRQEVDAHTPEGKREVVDQQPDTAIIKKLREENEKLIELTKEIDDKYKRSLADGENTRIRAKKQIEDAKVFGIQNFSKAMFEIADVLGKAIDTVPKEAITDDNQVLKNLFSGVQMTEQQLQTVFRRHGITQINPIGEKFNPYEHEAVHVVTDDTKEPGTVAEVIQIGYKLHDRTIRPAKVCVVKSSKS